MLSFRTFSLLIKPGVEILLENPYDISGLDPLLEIGRDYRVICSIMEENERFSWFEHFETELEKDYRGLVTINDSQKVCNILLFVEAKAIKALLGSLQISSIGPLSLLISFMPSAPCHVAKERRVFGLEIGPDICVTNRKQD